MKRYDAWSEPDTQGGYGGARCELYERILGQYVTFDDHERAVAARDQIISALLLAMKPGEEPKPEQYEGYDQLFRERLCRWNDSVKRYSRACEIAGRAE